MYINRNIESKLQSYASKFPILSLTGPRQAGKTTLLRKIFPQYTYLSLENPEIHDLADSDPNGFLEKYDKYVIFDEVQRLPKLFNYLQTKVDNDQIMGQYILSGSQNFLLLQSITQSLAGRVAILRLFPFQIQELGNTNLLNDSLDELMIKGFYPSIYNRNLLPLEYYPNYIESYVERDVRTVINVKDLRLFRTFLRLCAGRVGQIINYNNIANECGISMKTAQSWLTVLESSYIVFQLSPYYQNINKRLIKSPKLYFYDTGLLCYLLGIKDEELTTHYARGSIFENLIIADLFKADAHEVRHNNFYFYRDSNQNEVDCMIQFRNKFKLIEIKSGKTFNKEFLKGISYFEKTFPELTHQKYLIYGGNEEYNFLGTTILGWKKLETLSLL